MDVLPQRVACMEEVGNYECLKSTADGNLKIILLRREETPMVMIRGNGIFLN